MADMEYKLGAAFGVVIAVIGVVSAFVDVNATTIACVCAGVGQTALSLWLKSVRSRPNDPS